MDGHSGPVVGCSSAAKASPILRSTKADRIPPGAPIVRPLRVACCALALQAIAACTIQSMPNANGGAAAPGSPGAANNVDPAMLVRQEKSFETATATQGPTGWVSYFNDSSASFPPGQLIQMGRDAERRAITGALGDSSGHYSGHPHTRSSPRAATSATPMATTGSAGVIRRPRYRSAPGRMSRSGGVSRTAVGRSQWTSEALVRSRPGFSSR